MFTSRPLKSWIAAVKLCSQKPLNPKKNKTTTAAPKGWPLWGAPKIDEWHLPAVQLFGVLSHILQCWCLWKKTLWSGELKLRRSDGFHQCSNGSSSSFVSFSEWEQKRKPHPITTTKSNEKSPMFNRKYIFKTSMFQPAMLVYQRVKRVLQASHPRTLFLKAPAPPKKKVTLQGTITYRTFHLGSFESMIFLFQRLDMSMWSFPILGGSSHLVGG